MERIAEGVERELGRFGAHGAMAAIVNAWPEVVGAEIARNAWPARVTRDGVLLVHASSAAWVFELTQLAPVVHGRLAATMGDAAPKATRFVPGPIPEPLAEADVPRPATVIEPTEETRVRAAELTSGIGDEELRERVARAAALSLEHARSDRRF